MLVYCFRHFSFQSWELLHSKCLYVVWFHKVGFAETCGHGRLLPDDLVSSTEFFEGMQWQAFAKANPPLDSHAMPFIFYSVVLIFVSRVGLFIPSFCKCFPLTDSVSVKVKAMCDILSHSTKFSLPTSLGIFSRSLRERRLLHRTVCVEMLREEWSCYGFGRGIFTEP